MTVQKPHLSYKHNSAVREKMVFADNEVAYINEMNKQDVDVQSELANISRLFPQRKILFVHLSEIQEIYSNGAELNLSASDKSDRQSALIKLMQAAVRKEASDIHMVVRNNKTIIEFRIHGELYLENETSVEEGRLMLGSLFNSMIESSGDLNTRSRQQGRLRQSFAKDAGIWSARVATTPTDDNVAMALRLLYKRQDNEEPSIAKLGYSPEHIAFFNEFKNRGEGICLLSGGTGSGKSTTLECLLSEYSIETEGRRRILTIEHPVEFPIRGAVQTPITDGLEGDDIAEEFAHAISHSMRLDPDLMMIGEIRSKSSARAAFAAAMTGHGMLSTLHSNDWLTIFDRLRDIGITDSLLYDPTLIRCLANQSLTRVLCPDCKIKFSDNHTHLPTAVIGRIEKYCDADAVFLRGEGCKNCFYGITGRTVIAEVVSPTRKLMDAIKKGKLEGYDFWKESGGITKCSHLIQRINEGLVDPCLGEVDVCLLDTDDLLR